MKPFTTAAFVVFILVAIAQALRVALGWPVTINDVVIPPWASLIVCALAATLATMLRRENAR